jgi:hypothetical protein
MSRFQNSTTPNKLNLKALNGKTPKYYQLGHFPTQNIRPLSQTHFAISSGYACCFV